MIRDAARDEEDLRGDGAPRLWKPCPKAQPFSALLPPQGHNNSVGCEAMLLPFDWHDIGTFPQR